MNVCAEACKLGESSSRGRLLPGVAAPTPSVVLARTMYDAREFSAMPILADALQDAGCDSADFLDHCRELGPHVRGCWVVDLVLGGSKSAVARFRETAWARESVARSATALALVECGYLRYWRDQYPRPPSNEKRTDLSIGARRFLSVSIDRGQSCPVVTRRCRRNSVNVTTRGTTTSRMSGGAADLTVAPFPRRAGV